MATKPLTETWVIIKIGNREYAINQAFIKAFTELKHEMFLAESKGQFIRGTYSIFNSEIIVLDGHKLARETSQNDIKLEFSEQLTSVKIAYRGFIDGIEWNIMTGEKDDKLSSYKSVICDWINNTTYAHDKYLDKLFNRIKEHIIINLSRLEKLVEDKQSGELDLGKSVTELETVRREANRHILDGLDNMIDYYNSRISEMCMVVSASGKNFGISIDSVELVTNNCKALTSTKRTTLSAGLVDIDSKKYNVLDLTKISKIIG